MKKRLLSLSLVLCLVLTLVPAALPAAGASFTPVTGWDMMAKLGLGVTFANTTEARAWPWEDWTTPANSETHWGQPKIEQWQIKAVAEKGFDSYRMCVSWTPHMDADYKIDEAWLDRIQEIADWVLNTGMSLVINTHHEEELYWLIRDGEYEKAKKHLTAIWQQVAERFKDYPETLVFEIMNEPNLKERYGFGDEWIDEYDENGVWGVSKPLCNTVNKLNADALDTIRKSGGYNDKRVVMLCVPGASAHALPYMTVPDDDPYIMLGTFGYDSFINENTIHLVKSWLNKGIGFVNKEDRAGDLARTNITDLVGYTKKHFGELAGLGVPSFWFMTNGKPNLLDRTTGEWTNEPLLEALFSAYEIEPGTVEPPVFEKNTENVIDFEDGLLHGFTGRGGSESLTVTNEQAHTGDSSMLVTGRKSSWHGASLRVDQFVTADARIEISAWVRLNSPESAEILISTQIGSGGEAKYANVDSETVTKTGWVQLAGQYIYNTGHVDTGYITVYIESSNADAEFYIDDVTITNTSAARDPLDTAEVWAKPEITSAVQKGFVPEEIQDNYTDLITRKEFCKMAVMFAEYATGEDISDIIAEKGKEVDTGSFSDTSDEYILAAFALGITTGSVAPAPGKPGLFNPDGKITRQEAAAFLMRLCKVVGIGEQNTAPAGFTDIADAPGWAVEAINFCYNNGVVNGKTTNPLTYDPQGTYKRQEAIATFDRIKT